MIYVITAVHNRKPITEKFVDQLLRQTYQDIRFVLVDDGSDDGTADMVKARMPKAVILRGNGNLWWGGAMHEAYKWIKENGDRNACCLLTNDDVYIPDDYIENGLKILEKHPKTLLTGYGLSKQTGGIVESAVQFDFLKGGGNQDSLTTGNCASTRSLFFRVQDFITIGGFHPHLLPHYGSDYEWTIRAHRKYGYEIFCDTSLRYHVDEESTGFHQYDTMTRKQVFNKRSVSNPFYKMSFICLATPKGMKLRAIGCQLKRYCDKKDTIKEIIKR